MITGTLEGCSLTISSVAQGNATITICASDGEFETCCSFEVGVVEPNSLRLYVVDRQLLEGDTITACEEADSVILIIYTSTPWTIESEGDWFTAEQVKTFNAKIVFSENTTGVDRVGSVAVSDTQNHVINLVVFQSGDCNPVGIMDEESGGLFRIYPNPASERLVFEWQQGDLPEVFQVDIFNNKGQLKEQKDF